MASVQLFASSEESLRAEIAALRVQLAEAQETIEFQRKRRFELSKMLKVGFWEWDEKTHKPISFSPEMSAVLGLDQTRLEQLIRNPDAFNNILHPDDLSHYEANLRSRSLLEPGKPHVFDYRILVDQREIRFL